ncbi:hypothetical protein [Tateyamaria sp. SN3-11]|uniref:hypothetical protein n=1 Tax=Tateyamaria sp. SN3-11 TaxID=3092147 RepID=UPI0039E85690
MNFGDISVHLRKLQDEARARREADAPDRALRLYPEIVERWTGVFREAADEVGTGGSPCDYTPCKKAIGEVGLRHGFQSFPSDPSTCIISRARHFIEDVSMPAWPEPRRDLVEFALVVLETDVMLFRTGYAKRHLIKRLQCAPLNQQDIARLDVMLRRAVTRGAGLDEYRAWCKFAAYLVDEGYLGDLPAWLYPRAKGAFLNYSMADGRLARQFANAELSDAELPKLVGGILRSSSHAVSWPNFSEIIQVDGNFNTPEQRVKRNAWRMLDRIIRRIPSLERDLAVLAME